MIPFDRQIWTAQECALYKQEWSAAGADIYFGMSDRDYGRLTAEAWLDRHHRRFLLPIDEITAARVPFGADTDYYDGVYFLFDQDSLQYVGQSIRITDRLNEHAGWVPWFTHYAAVWVPRDFLDAVESYYIHSLRPPRNQQFRRPHSWAVRYIKA